MLLNCHTYYSLRYGTLSIQQLVDEAISLGHKAVTLTDINNTSAAIDFIAYAKHKGIKPIVGIEFRDQNNLAYIGIAKNKEGFKEINRHLTNHLLYGERLGKRAPEFNHVFIIYPMDRWEPSQLKENEFMGVQVNQRWKLSKHQAYNHKYVVFHPVTFKQTTYTLHRLLRAIANNKLAAHLIPKEVANANEFMPTETELIQLFNTHPKVIASTLQIMASSGIDIDLQTHKNKKTFTGSKEDDQLLLQKLAWDGFYYRYKSSDQEAKKRLNSELETITKLDFAAYFLVTWDIIRYAHNRGFHHVGRGSGANSIAAYCLKITDVDPVELNLYFERFINPYRTSPPDFDIDFSWNERDEVIDYIFKRYGKEHVGLIATYNTFQKKAGIRELGKVFGLPSQEIDSLITNDVTNPLNNNTLAKQVLHWAGLLIGFPNYLGIHAGGIIISEEPLNQYTALQMMPKGFPITHWDMHVAEDMGYHKYDILSQRGLGHIKDTVDLVLKNKKERIDIHDLQKIKQDKKVLTQLRSGDTIGCFYIESPAMRGLLKKLHCASYVDLIAASSIIRPGVASSGMMKQYIERFHNPKDFKYLHPIMQEHLQETFGIMIYQEDVIKIAHHFAGISLAHADILRRAMSGKHRSQKEMDTIKDSFFENSKQKGRSCTLTQEVWRQIASFSGYSFSKAHSASYAAESFQSLYLKAHYPLEFMVAVINNFGGFYSTELYVHEARMADGNIELPCINHSEHLTIIKGSDIYLGLGLIKQLEKKASEETISKRKSGPYNNLLNFIERTDIGVEQLILLIRTGALRSFKLSKPELMWQVYMETNPTGYREEQRRLFGFSQKKWKLPALEMSPLDNQLDEMELLGFSIGSPFESLKNPSKGNVLANELLFHERKEVCITGYYITRKWVRTITKDVMSFGCFTDQKGIFFDTVHFPQELKKYPFRGRGCYLITGKVQSDFGHPVIEIKEMEKLETKSRDKTTP
jgi:DNA polymerase-3 subunit alpha